MKKPVRVAVTGAAGDPTQGLQRRGQGRFTRFGLLIYEATLWSGASPEEPPLALRLDYRRSIAGRAIARASVDEMRRLGADEVSLSRWGAQTTTARTVAEGIAAAGPFDAALVDLHLGDGADGLAKPGRIGLDGPLDRDRFPRVGRKGEVDSHEGF